MTVEISMMIAIVGCFIGLAGWLSGRDKKISGDAEWRGGVNTQLKNIVDGVSGIGVDIKGIEQTQREQGEELAKVAASAASAHKRIDRLDDLVGK